MTGLYPAFGSYTILAIAKESEKESISPFLSPFFLNELSCVQAKPIGTCPPRAPSPSRCLHRAGRTRQLLLCEWKNGIAKWPVLPGGLDSRSSTGLGCLPHWWWSCPAPNCGGHQGREAFGTMSSSGRPRR